MAQSHPSDAPSHRSGRVRALVPLSVIAVVGAGSAIIPGLASAAPSLPAISAQDLLVKAAQSTADAFSGTVSVTTNLGLPELPDLGQGADPMSLLTGTHTLVVAANGPTRERIGLLGRMSEYELVHNGTRVWFYDSSSNSVQTATEPARAGDAKRAHADETAVPLTPQQAAARLLAAVGPSTAVTVDGTRSVARRAAYTLVLTPKQAGSLIGRVEIAVDAANGAPLAVRLYAAGATGPALDIAFTQVSFSAPPDSRFQFTPPAGATVTPLTGTTGAGAGAGRTEGTNQQPQVLGKDWLSVVEVHGVNLSELTGGAAKSSSSSNATGLFNGDTGSYLQALTGAGTTVHGAFGTGKLYSTSLLSVLITDDGRMFVGAVTTGVLRADADARGTR